MNDGVDVDIAREPAVNTHIHLPPNFSAFATVDDAVAQAAAEGLRVLGSNNYHDFRVYESFEATAVRHDIVALFGMEIICLVEDLQQRSVRANDPDNPGRMYLCGDGITRVGSHPASAQALIAQMRAVNEARIRRITRRLGELFAAAGLVTTTSVEEVVSQVAGRAGVPRDWVVLQERHVARGFQEELFLRVEPTQRAALGERDDVERPVELTVATPVEAHALDLPGTGRDRRHAGKCGKGVRGSKTPDVSNLGDEPSDGDRSRPRQPEERVPRDTRTEPSFEHLDLPLKASQADQERAGELGPDRGVPPQESGDLRSVARRHEVGDRPAIARHKDK
jgi:hypothetical protein